MPVTAIIVGAGFRSLAYAAYSEMAPDKLKIVGVAEPDPIRRRDTAIRFNIPEDMIFESSDELAQHERLADAVINGTMDHMHVHTSIPLIALGYDILLEKPIAVNAEELQELVKAARHYKTKILTCHVLRYAPYYHEIKKLISQGLIGSVIHLHLAEHVSYHHLALCYVRGKWADRFEAYSPMLLAKSSHDLDLMMWMKGVAPKEISSFGSDYQFRRENAPDGSSERCIPDCIYQDTCNYSAKNLHIKQQIKRSYYVWDELSAVANPTIEDLRHSLETDNPYGRCIWKTDRRNVDHQVVSVNFEDGATGTLDMIGGTARPQRKIHVIGTLGEIEGCFDDGIFTLRKISPLAENGYTVEIFNIDDYIDPTETINDGHGGGDMLLMKDFVSYLRDEETSLSATTLEDSIYGHAVAFAADRSMLEKRQVDIGELI